MVELDKTTKIYRQGKLLFALMPENILVKTTLNQSFFLMPRNHYSNARLNTIRRVIELGEIKDLNELASWTRPNIIWTSTVVQYDITNCTNADGKGCHELR